MLTARFEFNSPSRLGRFDPRGRARGLGPTTASIVLLGVYCVYFSPVAVDPGLNGTSTPDPAVEVRGSAPLGSRFAVILRNGYGWTVPVNRGRFASLVPLFPGLNRIQAAVNGRVSAPVDVTGPAVTAASVTTAMNGECSGTIAVHPPSGYEDQEDLVVINLNPLGAALVRRVTTDNPLCHDCDASRSGPDQFTLRQYYHGNGPFRIKFLAFDGDGKVRCQGESAELIALGPR